MRWTGLTSAVALAIGIGETAPKLLGHFLKNLLPEETLSAVAAPALIGLVLLYAALRRRADPFRRPRQKRMGWMGVTGCSLAGVVALTSAAFGAVKPARERLSQALVFELAVTDRTGCNETADADTRIIHVKAQLPDSARRALIETCASNPASSITDLIEASSDLEEKDAGRSDCHRGLFAPKEGVFEADYCVKGELGKATPLALRAWTPDGAQDLPVKNKESLKWFEKPAYW